jgi:hypothetical protein
MLEAKTGCNNSYKLSLVPIYREENTLANKKARFNKYTAAGLYYVPYSLLSIKYYSTLYGVWHYD